MQLSIIIVNYNVKYFLEHCVKSVLRACHGLQAEVLVVDNLSKDGSVAMMQQMYPTVHTIANTENVGFAKANNQALKIAKGKYVIYLNPDTIVAEDCFKLCIDYLENNPKVGALGPRLIDGKGQFLPESKRGFPSAKTAFYKIAGLSSLFKTSKTFNNYHLGHLSEFEINEVDILAGCFMMCRKDVLDKVGGFDEQYFMYGEDIDLSYQINKEGYKNVYFPLTSVLHYKGESTKKETMNYVRMFYEAMIKFAKKNFTGGNKTIYILLITLGVYFRAIIAFINRIVSVIKLPLLDAAVLIASLLAVKYVWVHKIKTSINYPKQLVAIFFLSYLILWLCSIFFSGGYDKPYKQSRLLRGMFIGTVAILILYGLMNEDFRFSRGITVLSALVGTVAILALRFVLQKLGVKSVETDEQLNKDVIVVGTQEEENSIKNLLQQAHIHKNVVGNVSPFEQKEHYQISTLSDLPNISKLYRVGEIIYAQHSITFKQIIESMIACGNTLNYKIHSIGTDSIIGSNSKNTAGDLYSTELVYNISTQYNKRNKRMLDIVCSLGFILLMPLLIWHVRDKLNYLKHCLLILEGDKTFVGYDDKQFPPCKPFVFPTYTVPDNYFVQPDNMEHLNWLYAKHYSVHTDMRIILENWRKL
jgi:GT2 family glycosyltransferase